MAAGLRFAFVLSVLAAPALAQERPLAPEDFLRLYRVIDAVPIDPERTAFLRAEPRPLADGPGGPYVTLWMHDTRTGESPLAVGRRVLRDLQLSPDGTRLTFLERREGDPGAQVYALPLAGGESRRLARTPNVLAHRWRPDGRALAYLAEDATPAARAAARAAGFQPVVLDEDWNHISLWLHDLGSGATTCLTKGGTVFDFAWAPDGSFLVAAMAPRNTVDASYMDKRLHVVDAQGAGARLAVANPGKLEAFAVAPDGKRVAYVSAADRRDPHAGMLYVADLASGQTRCLTEGLRGMVHHLVWNERLLATLSEGVRTRLVEVDPADGGLRTMAQQPGVAFRDFRHGAGRIVALASTAQHPPELYALGPDGALDRRTESNPWLATRALGRQETLRFAARDGLEIEGVLIHPAGRAGVGPAPLVIVVHGGPEAHYNDGWNTSYGEPGQVLAGRGWFAWYPNYRASTGYGVAFAKADHGDPMGKEFEDHLDAIAWLAGKGLIDRKRVGIVGASYGGYTAAWAATRHSEHFAAAVSGVPFVDIRTKWLTSDIPTEFFHVHYEETWWHQQEELLRARSPLTHATLCRTPLLLWGGLQDPRVHPSQPHMLYRAIRSATNTPVRYVQYPGEGHGNRTNVYQLDLALRMVQWLDHYLAPGERRAEPPPPLDLEYPLGR